MINSTRCCASLLILTLATLCPAQPTMELAGEWRFALDGEDMGVAEKFFARTLSDKITLPGTLSAQGYGEPPSFQTKWTGDGWRYPKLFKEFQSSENFKFPFFLQPPRTYVGAAWYQRDVQIPADWQNKRLLLHLERPHWQTTVWLDEKKIGSMDSLGVPHEFDLGSDIFPGKHTLTIRIDNRLNINVGPLSHSVTDHTQGNWNGIVGTIQLRATTRAFIDDVRVQPDVNNKLVRMDVTVGGKAEGKVAVRLVPSGPNPDAAGTEPVTATVSDGRATLAINLGARGQLWDEFTPHVYEAEVILESSEGRDVRRVLFGLREVGTQERRITLNGRKIFLRGTLECCIFPLTGHPPTDYKSWERIIRICKSHGLNHIRFHSWCPPKAAFEAADRLGFYFQVECSSWANQGAQIGSGTLLDAWIQAEAERMVKAYGNHPSFLMMCYGNEPAGPNHKKWLQDFVAKWKKTDPRRLYTTGAGWPVMSGSDFHSSPNPRIQGWGEGLKSIINARPPSTDFDWSAFVNKHADAPVISHEIGQWCVYPNFEEIPKYTGYFKAKNFEIFRELGKKSGIGDQARDMLMASGKLQVLAYKHDIEAALRTPDFGGFQLLDLHDFPGQGTALVGVLDAFWDSKGYISPGEFQRFCGPVVPLARMKKLILTTDETLEADLEVAQFGPSSLKQSTPTWKLNNANGVELTKGQMPPRDLSSGDLHKLGAVSVPMKDVKAPAHLILQVEVSGAVNSWDLFVYPAMLDTKPRADVLVTRVLDAAALAALKAGGKVLWLPQPSLVRPDPEHGPVKLGFSPIFWNTAWTNWQPPHTLGILCDPGHPALAGFPTQFHANWQWWEIVTGGTPFILTEHRDQKPIVQVIDDWVTSRKLALVFEASVTGGKLLACSANLGGDLERRSAARQFLRSLLDYAASDAFAPRSTMTLDQLRALVRDPSPTEAMGARILRANSQADGYAPVNLLDGDPKTLWHTAWGEKAPGFPHEVVIELSLRPQITRLRCTPRQDNNRNGLIREYAVYASDDPQSWGEPIAKGSFERNFSPKVITLAKPTESKYIRFVALSGFDAQPFASLAELEFLMPAPPRNDTPHAR